jgi:hypothetical protein
MADFTTDKDGRLPLVGSRRHRAGKRQGVLDSRANAVITGLLGWYFVPWASRALDWWLNPTPAAGPRVNWAGVGLIVALYGLCLLVFSQFPS